jgi:predicted MFS family arabinose efflux permease
MKAPTRSTSGHALTHGLVLLMAIATGIAVAGNYYAQPLLHTIATEFGVSFAQAGSVVTTAQLSYGAGLLLLVPLADLLEQRRLIVVMSMLAAVGLLLSGFAPSLPWLLAGTALTGLCSVVAQVLVPFAATLAEPEQRGRVVGTVMSGLLMGILLARTAAGALSSIAGWRVVYWAAALLMFFTAVALALTMPRYRQNVGLSYAGLLASVVMLFKQEPVLRLRALLGMLSFALFSIFWTPLAFFLAGPPYNYSDASIGLFGLVGAAGALAASWAGRLADRGKGVAATKLGLLCLLLAWLPLGFAPVSLLSLIAGVLLLDLAVQMVHVSNQNAIYKLRPEARNRLNAGYMTCYFIGGSFGSWLSANLYQNHGWMGVTTAGVALALLGVVIGLAGLRLQARPTSNPENQV